MAELYHSTYEQSEAYIFSCNIIDLFGLGAHVNHNCTYRHIYSEDYSRVSATLFSGISVGLLQTRICSSYVNLDMASGPKIGSVLVEIKRHSSSPSVGKNLYFWVFTLPNSDSDVFGGENYCAVSFQAEKSVLNPVTVHSGCVLPRGNKSLVQGIIDRIKVGIPDEKKCPMYRVVSFIPGFVEDSVRHDLSLSDLRKSVLSD